MCIFDRTQLAPMCIPINPPILSARLLLNLPPAICLASMILHCIQNFSLPTSLQPNTEAFLISLVLKPVFVFDFEPLKPSLKTMVNKYHRIKNRYRKS